MQEEQLTVPARRTDHLVGFAGLHRSFCFLLQQIAFAGQIMQTTQTANAPHLRRVFQQQGAVQHAEPSLPPARRDAKFAAEIAETAVPHCKSAEVSTQTKPTAR
jgi:hypothetical protein